jgi:hypothetical protein
MKKTTTLLLLLFFYVTSAQVCRPGKTELDVTYGKYSTMLRTGGDLFWNGSKSRMGYYINEETQVPLIFAGGVWIGAKLKTGETRFSGVSYRSLTDNYDWYPGPLDKNGQTKENDCKNWDRIFSIKQIDIKITIDVLFHGQAMPDESQCDLISDAVKSWPAKGNPFWKDYYSFDLPDQDLASFFDFDLDGLYNPCKGDLPALTSQNCSQNHIDDVLNSFRVSCIFGYSMTMVDHID